MFSAEFEEIFFSTLTHLTINSKVFFVLFVLGSTQVMARKLYYQCLLNIPRQRKPTQLDPDTQKYRGKSTSI